MIYCGLAVEKGCEDSRDYLLNVWNPKREIVRVYGDELELDPILLKVGKYWLRQRLAERR